MLNKINISVGKQKLIVYIVLTLVTLAVFWQVSQFNFINFDDDVYVTENSHIQSEITLEEFRWAFSTTHADFWHPLTWMSLIVDYQFYGPNAGGYHVTNVVLHILSTLLLFWLFNRMTGAVWKSAFVAALFALHPLHVESVAWIAKRKDVLSAFFWMLTLCLYVYYTEKPAIRRYLLVLFSFFLALMSKPMVVTLPVIMILLDYWPLGRFNLHKSNLILWQLKEKTPFFVLSVVFSIITIYAHNNLSVGVIPLTYRIANAPVSFVTYLEKIFWPHDLAVFYPFSVQLPLGQVLGFALLILVVSAAFIATVKRLPFLFVGWLWYAITILPVIGIVQVSLRAMSDNYTYLPSIGIAIVLAWGIPLLFPREDIRKKILFPTSIAVLSIWTVLTWQQCGYWKNSITLFAHALQVTKNNYLAHNSLASALVEIGNYDEAIYHFDQAILIRPNFAYYYSNRGDAYAKHGQYHQAIKDYNEAVRLEPDFAELYCNRGTTYAEFGHYQKAIEDFNKAIILKQDYVDAYYNKGAVYAKLYQYQKAIEEFNKAISLNPDYALAYHSRGIAYLSEGDNKNGCRDAQIICAKGNCQLLKFAKAKGYCR